MLLKLVRDWSRYKAGQCVDISGTMARWLVETGRAVDAADGEIPGNVLDKSIGGIGKHNADVGKNVNIGTYNADDEDGA